MSGRIPIIISLLALVLISGFPYQPTHRVEAQEVRYDWTGLSMSNGTAYPLPGGFELYAEIIRLGAEETHGQKWNIRFKIIKEGVSCTTFAYVGIGAASGFENRKEVPVYEGCTVRDRLLYRVKVYGDKSSVSNATIVFDILGAVYSPDVNVSMNLDFPEKKEFDEPHALFKIPVTITNHGPWSVERVSLRVSWVRVEGEGSINFTSIAPSIAYDLEGNEVNLTLDGLEPNESKNLTFSFTAGPGEGKYGNYSVSFLMEYPVKFKYIGFDSIRNVKIYRFSPGEEKSETESVFVFFGVMFKGHTGAPNVVLSFSKPTGQTIEVNPGTPVNFVFRLQNTGTDDAYNVTIRARIDPTLPIEIRKPEAVAGRTFPLVVQATMPPKALTEPIEFRILIPEDAEGMTYKVNVSVGFFNIVGEYFERFKTFTISVRELGEPRVYIEKSITSTTIPINGTIEVTVIVGNNGTAPATNVVVEDSYPKDIFRLVSGKTKLTASSLPPGGTLALTYTLKAVREGVATFGPAKVTFLDPREGQKTLLSEQKTPVVITVVKPKVSFKVEEVPQNVTVVNSLVGFTVYAINRGSGPAKDLTVVLELSPGYYMVSPPELKKGEGVTCDQPVWEPKEDRIVVKAVCDTVAPDGHMKLILTLKAQGTGRQWIRVKEVFYKAPDGKTILRIPTSTYYYESVVVTPFEMRMFYLAIYAFSILLVAMFVIGMTRGFRVGLGRRSRRLGFGQEGA